MRLTPQALARDPSAALGSVCLVFGQEPLLIEETCDRIRRAASQGGYHERLSFLVNTRVKFDWDQLWQLTASQSLFAERRLLEIRLAGSGLGNDGIKFVHEFLSEPQPDNMLLIIAGAFDRRAQGAKWFKQIDAEGVTINHAAVTSDQLPAWLAERLRGEGIKFDNTVVDRLAYLLEGNLLAAAQEIKKLALLYGGKALTESDIDAALVDHARFDVFSYVDDCLLGRGARALRMLAGLRREGVEPVMIIWVLARECRVIAQLAAAKAAGMPSAQAFKELAVWRTRQGLVRQALGRMTALDWQHSVQRLAEIDRMAKGRLQVQCGASVWDELTRLTMDIAQRNRVVRSSRYA